MLLRRNLSEHNRAIIIKLVLFFALFAVAVYLRTLDINRPLWADEIITLNTLSANWLSNPMLFGVTSNLPLFFYVFKAWGLLVDTNAVWQLRLLPMLFSLATLAVWFFFIKRQWGFVSAFLFGVIFATAPLQVYYSLELRPYALVQFLLSLQMMVFYLYIQSAERKYIWFLALLSVFALLTHFCAYFFIFSQGLLAIYLYLKKRSESLRNTLPLYLFLAVFSFGIYKITLLNPNFIKSVDELRVSTDKSFRVIPSDLVRLKELFVMYYWYGLYYYRVDWIVQFVFKKIMLLVAAAAVYLLFKTKNTERHALFRYSSVILLITLLLTVLLENLGFYPFGGRHVMPYSVFYYALVIFAVSEIYKKFKLILFIPIMMVALFITFNLYSPCAANISKVKPIVEIYKDCWWAVMDSNQ